MSTKAVEIYVIESMLREVNPLIPADLRKFFQRKVDPSSLMFTDGYTIDAYMGNRGASNHIHSHGEKGFRIQAWLHNNELQAGDVLRFERIDQEHYKLSLLKE